MSSDKSQRNLLEEDLRSAKLSREIIDRLHFEEEQRLPSILFKIVGLSAQPGPAVEDEHEALRVELVRMTVRAGFCDVMRRFENQRVVSLENKLREMPPGDF